MWLCDGSRCRFICDDTCPMKLVWLVYGSLEQLGPYCSLDDDFILSEKTVLTYGYLKEESG